MNKLSNVLVIVGVVIILLGLVVNYSWAEQTYVWGDDGSLTIVTSDTPPNITYKTNPDTNQRETEISVTPQEGEKVFILGDELTIIENTSLGIISY
jgi:hypothetical protein